MTGKRIVVILILLVAVVVSALLTAPAASAQTARADDAWRGEYFNNRDLRGRPVFVRYDPEINFDFGYGSPGAGIGADNFSVRWTRTVYFADTGTYEFGARTDDGVRLWVGDKLVIDEWYPRQGQWALGQVFLPTGLHTVRMEYYEGVGWAQAHLGWRLLAGQSNWSAAYFANETLSGAPVLTREEAALAFDWGADSPDPAVPADYFSARFTRGVYLLAGTYRFHAISDDGVRFYLDGRPIIDAWLPQGRVQHSVDIALETGSYTLQVEYFERTGEAALHAWWEPLVIVAPPEGPPDTPPGAGVWLGEYFSNRDLQGPPTLVRNDAQIDFNWGDGPPHPALPRDNFSVRWTKTVQLSRGTWRFHADVDDGVRIWANDHSLIYQWIETENGIYYADLSLTEGGTFRLTVEYFEATGYARAKVWYEKIDNEPR